MNIQQENSISDTNGAPVRAVNVGKTLREAREKLGLSVADVANRIKFAAKQIEWLEDDDYARLPEAAFVRGFVRSYARLVELDPAQLLATLPSSHIQPSSGQGVKSVEIPMPTALTARRHNIIWLVAALAVALSLAIFERLHDRSSVENKPIAKTTVEPIVLPIDEKDIESAPLLEQVKQDAGSVQGDSHEAPAQTVSEPARIIHQPVRVEPVPAPVPSPSVTQKTVRVAPAPAQRLPAPQQPSVQQSVQTPRPLLPPVAKVKKSHASSAILPSQLIAPQNTSDDQSKVQPAAQSSDASGQAKVTAEAGTSEHALRIELDQDAWVEVRDGSDKALISKMYPAGSLLRVVGRGPLLVTLGNASAARLFDNGKKINLARFTTAEVAKVKLK